MNEEHLESVPWSTLLDAEGPRQSRLIYLAAGAVVVFAIAAVVTKAVWTPRVAEPAGTSPIITTTPLATDAATAPPATSLFSEADLMASLDAEAHRGAAAFAEWFVHDFFTLDGDHQTLEDVLAALPPGVPGEQLPHGRTDGTSYVEWAATSQVAALGPGRFEVTVLFRTIVAEEGADFRRLPVRAVSVAMDMSADGGFRLTDLPAVTATPARPDVADWIPPDGPAAPAGLPGAWGGNGSTEQGTDWVLATLDSHSVGPAWPLLTSG